jgi:hypothetical protein
MATQQVKEDEDGEAFMSITWCEEDRRQLCPGVAWNGGYRWFRSPNIIPLERFKTLRVNRENVKNARVLLCGAVGTFFRANSMV